MKDYTLSPVSQDINFKNYTSAGSQVRPSRGHFAGHPAYLKRQYEETYFFLKGNMDNTLILVVVVVVVAFLATSYDIRP